MNQTETVERLTGIIARQAAIIKDLYMVVQQLDATTSLDKEIEAIQAEAATYTQGSE